MITGFGRLRYAPSAADYVRRHAGHHHLTAKGVTNGAVPMGAVFVNRARSDDLHDRAAEQASSFFTATPIPAHPLACAAGIATLDTYGEEGLLTRAKRARAPYWRRGGAFGPEGLPCT